MKILLAGATGAIGRLLLPLLVAAGHEVVGTTRSPARLKLIAAAGGDPALVNCLDRAKVFELLRGKRPEVVIHQLTDLSTYDLEANSRLRIEGTRNLVDASLEVGVERMIAQSIAFAYAPGSGPAKESDPLHLEATGTRGLTVAGVQALEQAVAEIPTGVVLRYGVLYGPGTWYSRDGLIAERLRRGELVASDAITSFVHVVDAAQAAVDALGWPAGPVNIVDDEPAAERIWLQLFATMVDAPIPIYRPGREGWQRGATNQKARELGWQPRYPTWRRGFLESLSPK